MAVSLKVSPEGLPPVLKASPRGCRQFLKASPSGEAATRRRLMRAEFA